MVPDPNPSEAEEKPKPRRRWRILAFLFVLGGLLVWQFSFRSGVGNARILTVLPKDLTYISRSQMDAKPWFDVTLFGRQIRFPSTKELPSLVVPSTRQSGLIAWSTASGFSYHGVEWKNESGTYFTPLLEAAYGSEFVELPYVYGDRPQRFTVTLHGEFSPNVSFEVELPPNGEKEIDPAPQEVTVGKLGLRFERQRRPSPNFEARYRVDVLDAPGELILLDLSESNDWIQPILLKSTPGKVTTYAPTGASRIIHITLHRVLLVKTTVEAVVVSGAAGRRVKLITPNGEVLVKGNLVSSGVFRPDVEPDLSSTRRELLIGGVRLDNLAYAQNSSSTNRPYSLIQGELKVSPGQKLPATYYHISESNKATIALND